MAVRLLDEEQVQDMRSFDRVSSSSSWHCTRRSLLPSTPWSSLHRSCRAQLFAAAVATAGSTGLEPFAIRCVEDTTSTGSRQADGRKSCSTTMRDATGIVNNSSGTVCSGYAMLTYNRLCSRQLPLTLFCLCLFDLLSFSADVDDGGRLGRSGSRSSSFDDWHSRRNVLVDVARHSRSKDDGDCINR